MIRALLETNWKERELFFWQNRFFISFNYNFYYIENKGIRRTETGAELTQLLDKIVELARQQNRSEASRVSQGEPQQVKKEVKAIKSYW